MGMTECDAGTAGRPSTAAAADEDAPSEVSEVVTSSVVDSVGEANEGKTKTSVGKLAVDGVIGDSRQSLSSAVTSLLDLFTEGATATSLDWQLFSDVEFALILDGDRFAETKSPLDGDFVGM